MRPKLLHVTRAPREAATLMYWLASTVAPRVNVVPAHARMALQSLALLASARVDRIGDRAAARFATITGREIDRLAPPDNGLPPAA